MTSIDRWIDRQLRRLALGRFLQQAAEWLAGFLFVFGMVVLAVKLLLPGLWPHVLWLATGVVPVAGIVWWLSRRGRYTRTEAVALLDRKLGTGGLLMTLAEQPDPRWATRLPQAEIVWKESLPKVRPVRFLRYLALPLLFAVGACFVPLREARTAPVIPKAAGQQASEQLQEMLAALEEADALDEEEKQELREEIEKLTEEAEDTPLTHEKWETVDALEERLRMRLDAASMTVAKSRSAAAALAGAGEGGEPLSAEQTEQLERELLQGLEKLARNGGLEGLQAGLKAGLQSALQSGRLSGDLAQRQQFLQDLQKLLDVEAQKLAQCRGKCQQPGGT